MVNSMKKFKKWNYCTLKLPTKTSYSVLSNYPKMGPLKDILKKSSPALMEKQSY